MHTTKTGPDVHLAQLARKLAELVAALRAGDRLPHPQQAPTPAQAAASAALAAQERWDVQLMAMRGLVPVGASPAPLDIPLLDLLRSIRLELAELAAAIADRVAPDLTPPPPGRVIQRIGDLLPLTARVPDLAEHAHAELRRLDRRAGAALGDVEPLVRIGSVRCPVCACLSLRLLEDRDQALCVNSGCRCPDLLCGCHDTPPRRHIWHRNDWFALATDQEMEPAA